MLKHLSKPSCNKSDLNVDISLQDLIINKKY